MRKDNKGMTLIELLVAITMLAVVISPFLKTFIISAKQNNKARETLRATTVAQNLMEGLEAFSLEDICEQVNKITGPKSKLYMPRGYEDHTELGIKLPNNSIEKSGNGQTGENYEFKSTSSNKYEIGIKGIIEDGKKYDAKISLDASGYTALNSNNDFEVTKMNENSDMVFFLSREEEKEKIGNLISWSNVSRRITFKLNKNATNDNTEVRINVDYLIYFNENSSTVISTISGKELTRTFSDLQNIYFMYYPSYARGGVEDEFIVDYNSDDTFNLCLIKQKYPADEPQGSDANYCASLNVNDKNTDQKRRITLRTNIMDDLNDGHTIYATALMYKYIVNGALQHTDNAQALMGFENTLPQSLIGQTSNQNAIYKTTVQVFPEGTYPDKFDETESIAQLGN